MHSHAKHGNEKKCVSLRLYTMSIVCTAWERENANFLLTHPTHSWRSSLLAA